MEKGQGVSLDFVTGMTIFIVAIFAGFYTVQTTTAPSDSFIEQVEAATELAWNNFRDETEWEVKQAPVILSSERNLDGHPVEFDIDFPGSKVDDSVLVMRGEDEVVSQHDAGDNSTLFIADLRNGTISYDLVWTEEAELADRNYTTALTVDGDRIWNSRMNLTFSQKGLSKLEFNESGLLQGAADLGGSSSPTVTEELLRGNATYSGDGMEILVFEDSTRIEVTEDFSGEREWHLNLTDSFHTLYSEAEGGTVDLNTAGTIYASSTDWVDFYDDSSGLSIVGNDIFVNVTRNSSDAKVEAHLNFTDENGGKDLLVYPHDGNYTHAENRKADFYDTHNLTVGTTETLTGISEAEAADLESKSTDEIASLLELGGLGYNITLPGVFDAGDDIPQNTDVVVKTFPISVLERFGNATVNDLKFRVWR